MAIDLYYTPGSAPCRVVLLVAAALNVPLNHKLLDLSAGEHLTPEFLKFNPQHTVPTIVDDGFALWESRAISRYLVNKYGGDSTLYPSDPQARALVDSRLDFDLGTLYPRFSDYFYPQLFGGKADPGLLKKLKDGLGFLETFLAGQKYVAGSELTLADLSLVATVSTIEAADIVDFEPFRNVLKWYELVKSTAPGYKEANEAGIRDLKQFIAKLKAKTEL